jgi:cellobiose-specific phosphotransferase system component IIA
MKQSAPEAIQMMVLFSTAAKTTIRECFGLMKTRDFSQVEQKMQEVSILIEQTRELEKKLLDTQTRENEPIDDARFLYASTHFLATTVLFETALEMQQLYKLGFSC